MRILAISGSLRTGSSNTRAVEALARLAPDDVEIIIWRELGQLPHFNPDLDADSPPAPVQALRREISLCDGLIICSPEYAHGVAGVMKNALDWLVGSLEFSGTPVALINASPRATLAQAHMRGTLEVMDARVVEAASIAVPLTGVSLTSDEIATDPALGPQLQGLLEVFAASIRTPPG